MATTRSKLMMIALLSFVAVVPSAMGQRPERTLPAATGKAVVCNTGCAIEGTQWSISNTPELYINPMYKAVVAPGVHKQEVRLIAPSGGVYQKSSTDVSLTSRLGFQKGTPERLLIAGTWIDDRKMVGTWEIEVYLDGTLVGTQELDLTY